MEPTLDNLEPGEQAGYGVEVLCASWTPLETAIAKPAAPAEGGGEITSESAAADVEAFLTSFYRFQQG